MALMTTNLSYFLLMTAVAHACNLSTVIPLKAAQYGTTFDVAVRFGDQTFNLLLDTGSSDTWVLGNDWRCVQDIGGPTMSRSACLFGNSTYYPSNSFQPTVDAWLGDQYGDGDAVGTLGYEKIQIGNIAIPRQKIGIVNESSTIGDSLNSGIAGFGYPSISATHPSSHRKNESFLEDTLPYSTIFPSLISEGMDPFISLALERLPLNQKIGFGGFLGLGTLPPVLHGRFAAVPVEVTKAIPVSLTNGIQKITEWTLTVDSVHYAGRVYNESFQAVVDSGNWLNIVPDKLAEEVNSAFSPPAFFLPDKSYYQVRCNATAPEFATEIGGKIFPMDARDMIWQDEVGSCFSSVAPGGADADESMMFLGAQWLKNVVAVFDMGNDEMRFAARRSAE